MDIYIYIYIYRNSDQYHIHYKAETREKCDISLQDYFNVKEIALGLEFQVKIVKFKENNNNYNNKRDLSAKVLCTKTMRL